MSLSTYLKQCNYSIGELGDYIYLLEDNDGVVAIDGVTPKFSTESAYIKLKVTNITFEEETISEGKYNFQRTISFDIKGYFPINYVGIYKYLVFQNKNSSLFLFNYDNEGKFEYDFIYNKENKQTTYTVSLYSNFPILIIDDFNGAIDGEYPYENCTYTNAIEPNLLLGVYREHQISGNTLVNYTTNIMSQVEADNIQLEEIYDGEKFVDTVSFDIPLDHYTNLWNYRLLERNDNEFVATIDDTYHIGFGTLPLKPSYSSDNNAVTVDLTLADSLVPLIKKTLSEGIYSNILWVWVSGYTNSMGEYKDAYTCVANGRAIPLLQEARNAIGKPLGYYRCVDGFENDFDDITIQSTVSSGDSFIKTDCYVGSDCEITTNMTNSIHFTSTTTTSFSIRGTCDWRFTDIPSWLTVSPTTGAGGTNYTVTMKASSISSTYTEAFMTLQYGLYEMPIKVSKQSSGYWVQPYYTVSTDANSHKLIFLVYGAENPRISNNPSGLTYTFNQNRFMVNVPFNSSTSSRTFTLGFTSDNFGTVSRTISQQGIVESWVESDEMTCVGTSLYFMEQLWTGVTSSSLSPTEEYRLGDVIETSSDSCPQSLTKWVLEGTACSDGNTWVTEYEYSSDDSGATWTQTGEYRLAYLSQWSSDECEVLTFADPYVKAALVEQYDTSGDGELQRLEISGVTSIPTSVFRGNTNITRFNEFAEYFTDVNDIDSYQFEGCTSLLSVTIPSGVTSISHESFYECTALTSITIPDSVTSIDAGAFAECTNLTLVDIGSGLTASGLNQFAFTNATQAIYGYGLGSFIFRGEYIPFSKIGGASLTSYPNWKCADIYVNDEYYLYYKTDGGWEYDERATNINTISSLSSNTKAILTLLDGSVVAIPSDGTTTLRSDEIDPYRDNIREAIICTGVTYVDDYAFANSTNMTKLIISENVMSLGKYAFYNCRSLSNIIDNGTTSHPAIDSTTFRGVASDGILTHYSEVNYDIWLSEDTYYLGYYGWTPYPIGPKAILTLNDNSIVRIGSNGSTSLLESELSAYTATCVSAEVKSVVETIGYRAFANFSQMTAVTISDGVETISNAAFGSCARLTGVTIPDSVTTMGTWVFSNNPSLTTVTIGSGLSSIPDYTFNVCVSLSSIYIPNNITSIGANAFSGCYSLQSISVGANTTSIGANSFSGCTGLTSLTLTSNVESIGRRAFQGTNITEVAMPDTVTYLGDSAFQACSALTSVTISTALTEIATYVFYKCSSLKNITIPNAVTTIGGYSFQNCTALTSVTIGSSCTEIGASTFEGCSSLFTIYCHANTVPTIAYNTFKDVATGGTLFFIGGLVYSTWMSVDNFYLGYASWNYAAMASDYQVVMTKADFSTENINFPSGIMPDNTLSGKTDIVAICIGENITSIGQWEFYNDTAVKVVSMPSTITFIGRDSFRNCSSLMTIYAYMETAPGISYTTFNDVTTGGKLYVPIGSESSYDDEWMSSAIYWLGYYNWTLYGVL